MCRKVFTFVGSLESGEAIYVSRQGEICIEKDHDFLVEATPEEKAEVRSRMSLIPVIEPTKGGKRP